MTGSETEVLLAACAGDRAGFDAPVASFRCELEVAAFLDRRLFAAFSLAETLA